MPTLTLAMQIYHKVTLVSSLFHNYWLQEPLVARAQCTHLHICIVVLVCKNGSQSEGQRHLITRHALRLRGKRACDANNYDHIHGNG